MRTTVTLEPDVDELLRKEMEAGGKRFKEAINDAIRRGLAGRRGPAEPPFTVHSRPLRLRRGIDPARVRELDDELEIAEFRRKTRMLEERRGDHS